MIYNCTGIIGEDTEVNIEVEYDPGGEEGEFDNYMRACLSDWFDGASVVLKTKSINRKQLQH